MSTSLWRLCVWRREATDRTWLFFFQLDNGRCGSILGKMSHTSLRRGQGCHCHLSRALSLSLLFCTVIVLFFAISLSLFLLIAWGSAAFWSLSWAPFLPLFLPLLVFCRSICFHLKLIWLHLRIPKVFCQQQFRPRLGSARLRLRLRWVASLGYTLFAYVRLFALNCRKLLQAPWLRWCVCVRVCVVLGSGGRLGISAAQKTLHFGIDFAYT